LCQLRENDKDKLRHNVLDIILVGRNYAIYRTKKGIYVQFSDDDKEETAQRRRFTEICPELCELRYFTSQMQPSWTLPFRGRRDEPSLYDHNIAQAIWLVMEDRIDLGKPIAQQAAALGFVAGFAERLVPNILRWTSAQLEVSVGTPAQAVRSEEKQQGLHETMSTPKGSKALGQTQS
jgi:hypothetical protein